MNVLLFAPSLLLLMLKVQSPLACYWYLLVMPIASLTFFFLVQAMSIKGVFFALLGAAALQVHCVLQTHIIIIPTSKNALLVKGFPSDMHYYSGHTMLGSSFRVILI